MQFESLRSTPIKTINGSKITGSGDILLQVPRTDKAITAAANLIKTQRIMTERLTR